MRLVAMGCSFLRNHRNALARNVKCRRMSQRAERAVEAQAPTAILSFANSAPGRRGGRTGPQLPSNLLQFPPHEPKEFDDCALVILRQLNASLCPIVFRAGADGSSASLQRAGPQIMVSPGAFRHRLPEERNKFFDCLIKPPDPLRRIHSVDNRGRFVEPSDNAQACTPESLSRRVDIIIRSAASKGIL